MMPAHENTPAASSAGGPLDAIQLGIGNWAWTDQYFWGNPQAYSEADARAAFEVSLAHGVTFIDTAEVYGFGGAERMLGRFMRGAGQSLMIATKFYPYPWRLTRGSLRRALEGSLRRLGVEQVALYQIHVPLPPVPIEAWMEALADVVDAGLTQRVGVSNYNLPKMRRAFAALSRRGVRLASNQVDFSLLQRAPERDGLLAACHELGVRLIAYSPLAQGLLTGKYTPDSPPPAIRRRRYARVLGRIEPLIGLMREIGEAHGGKSVAQVALNWAMCKGTLPIPSVRSAQQAEENAGALSWQLTDDQVAALDEMSDRIAR